MGGRRISTPEAVQLGFIDLANGSQHLEVPLGEFPQRGKAGYAAMLVYDSRIWHGVDNGSSRSWQPDNVAGSQGGWRFVTTASEGSIASDATTVLCGSGSLVTGTWKNFRWTAPDGTRRDFDVQTSHNECTGTGTASGDAFASDSSGFHLYVTNYTDAKILARDGTQVYPQVKDTNGNYFSKDGNGNIIDTLGRTPILITNSGNQTYYDVLNSQGTRSRFTVTTGTVTVSTTFAQSGVTEYSGQITVITRIDQPDGSAYVFDYESGYGLLSSVTLPTGGTAAYTHANFTDAYGNVNRWVASRNAFNGTWTYTPSVISTCSAGQTGCQQKTIVRKPSNDEAVYTFTLNNGSWNTQVTRYWGLSSTGTLLQTETAEYDFTNACPTGHCTGARYIRPTRLMTTLPIPSSSVTSKTELSYDSPQKGNVTQKKEWRFYTGTAGAADRTMDLTYETGSSYLQKDIANLVTSTTTRDAAGTQVARIETSYDSTALTSVSGIAQHDSTNYGTGNTVRGNPTQARKWVSGSTYLTTTYEYDTTGQMRKETNPRGHSRLYSYADSFYTDNGANPPQAYTPGTPTNAYLTEITLVDLPGSGKNYFSYYYHSGNTAVEKDQNLSSTYKHYLDPLDRQTHEYSRRLANNNRGWKL